jgi:hypothetical protein
VLSSGHAAGSWSIILQRAPGATIALRSSSHAAKWLSANGTGNRTLAGPAHAEGQRTPVRWICLGRGDPLLCGGACMVGGREGVSGIGSCRSRMPPAAPLKSRARPGFRRGLGCLQRLRSTVFPVLGGQERRSRAPSVAGAAGAGRYVVECLRLIHGDSCRNGVFMGEVLVDRIDQAALRETEQERSG